MSDVLIPSAEVVPTPKCYPRGIDKAVAWPGGFSLSYWDLWFLLTLQEKYESSVARLETEMKAKITEAKFGVTFAPRDKVMVTQNDYDKDVVNGDIGFVDSLDLEESVAVIDFDGRKVEFDFSEMDILSLAYAVTVHKSQGSEYPAVVIPVAMQHYLMLKRNLIYTALTRGKKLVVVIGQKKALAMAVKSKAQGERWNNLAARLKNVFDAQQKD